MLPSELSPGRPGPRICPNFLPSTSSFSFPWSLKHHPLNRNLSLTESKTQLFISLLPLPNMSLPSPLHHTDSPDKTGAPVLPVQLQRDRVAWKERSPSCWMPPSNFTTHHPSPISGISQIARCTATASIPALIPALGLPSELLYWFLIGLLTSSSPTSVCLPCCPRPRVPLQSAGGTPLPKTSGGTSLPGGWRPGLRSPFAVHPGLGSSQSTSHTESRCSASGMSAAVPSELPGGWAWDLFLSAPSCPA